MTHSRFHSSLEQLAFTLETPDTLTTRSTLLAQGGLDGSEIDCVKPQQFFLFFPDGHGRNKTARMR